MAIAQIYLTKIVHRCRTISTYTLDYIQCARAHEPKDILHEIPYFTVDTIFTIYIRNQPLIYSVLL